MWLKSCVLSFSGMYQLAGQLGPGILTRPQVSWPRPVSHGHRPKAKAENAKENFWVNATVNPVFQF